MILPINQQLAQDSTHVQKNMASHKTVFFDRDGTLIIDKIYLNDPEQITYLPGVFEALQELRDAGYKFVVVTNQSGVARGIVTIENLHEIHRRIEVEFAKHGITFAGFYYAPYSVESNHELRKPNPGMLLAAENDHGIDLTRSWMIGDRGSDVVAGHRAGCRTILLEGVENADTISEIKPHFVTNDLRKAARFIIDNEPKNEK
jgi:D-glycero-D-manno-heptose 1,7-bisphosphate phosphatase